MSTDHLRRNVSEPPVRASSGFERILAEARATAPAGAAVRRPVDMRSLGHGEESIWGQTAQPARKVMEEGPKYDGTWAVGTTR